MAEYKMYYIIYPDNYKQPEQQTPEVLTELVPEVFKNSVLEFNNQINTTFKSKVLGTKNGTNLYANLSHR